VKPRRRAGALVAAGLAATLAAAAVRAAPGDALLTAWPERDAARGIAEISVARASRSFDFAAPDDAAAPAPDAPTGGRSRYGDVQLGAGARIGDGLWLAGRAGQRTLGDGVDRFRYRQWLLSAQARVHDGGGAIPAVALRVAAWGHRAGAVETSTPVVVRETRLDTVRVERPSDRQLQLDAIATWTPRTDWQTSVALGVGRSRLGYRALSATTQLDGCRYALAFNGNDVFGELAEPCDTGGGVVEQFYDETGTYGVDVVRELGWRGRFVQAAVGAAWRGERWSLRGGLLLQRTRRDVIDDALRQRGRPWFRATRIVTLEAAWRFQPAVEGVLRLDTGRHLLVADLPVTYNAASSGRLAGRTSLLTVGLRASF
jgi:hypothetical protein